MEAQFATASDARRREEVCDCEFATAARVQVLGPEAGRRLMGMGHRSAKLLPGNVVSFRESSVKIGLRATVHACRSLARSNRG